MAERKYHVGLTQGEVGAYALVLFTQGAHVDYFAGFLIASSPLA